MFHVLPVGWVIVMAFFVIARVAFRTRRFQDRAPSYGGKRAAAEHCTARIATKRQHVSGGGHHWPATTDYFVTFERENDGARQEFEVTAGDYSALAEGDAGQLGYRDERFLSFDRNRTGSGEAASAPAPDSTPVKTCSYCGGALPHNKIKCQNCGWNWRPEPARNRA